MNDSVTALLAAYERVVAEREEARIMMTDNEFKRGHVNGLNEALNRIEEEIKNES